MMENTKQAIGEANGSNAIQEANAANVQEGTPVQPVLPPVDAQVRAVIDQSDLAAYLRIDPPENGGAGPTLEKMRYALAAAGVAYNIDMNRLNELEDVPVYNSFIQIAQGFAPQDGVNGTVTFYIRTEKPSMAPKIKPDGTVDYFDLDIVENVKKGQVLCTITHPTEGAPGMSVRGRELKQTKGRPVASYVGSNTALTEDGTAIVSKIDGQVVFANYRISVNETFQVRGNVDHSTGNLNVVGNIVIAGAVTPGFKVEATGNIQVGGVVESAAIKAGGNIRLQGGAILSEITCEGDLTGRFIENCGMFVKGDIQADYIVDSNIRCGKNIRAVGSKARIIGGSLIAGQNVEARIIGSPSGVVTRIELGADPAVLMRQQQLTAQITEMEKSIKSMQPLLDLLRQMERAGVLTPEKREILDNVSYSFDNNAMVLESSRQEMAEISQQLQKKGYGRVVCTEVLHSGTVVVIGGVTFYVKLDMPFAGLYYQDGEVRTGMAR